MSERSENLTQKPLWVCPKCGETFVSPNMWHSCGKYSLQALFAGSEPHVFVMYQKFEQMVQAIGPVTVIPKKHAWSFRYGCGLAAVYRANLTCCVICPFPPSETIRVFKRLNNLPRVGLGTTSASPL